MRTYFLPACLAAISLLAACGGGSTTGNSGAFVPVPTPTATATSIAIASPVSGSPFKHVIVIIQENRTFDNLFASSVLSASPACSADAPPAGLPSAPSYGPYPDLDPVAQAEGLSPADTYQMPLINGGATTCLAAMPFEAPYDPDHSNHALYTEASTAGNAGFALNGVEDTLNPSGTPAPGAITFGVVPAPENELYHILAYYNALADNMFSSRLAPTFPGHQFLIAGESTASDDPLSAGATPPPNGDPYDASNPYVWGCDSPSGTTVPTWTSSAQVLGQLGTTFPCFNYQTIGDLMDGKGVSWKYYTGQLTDPIEAAFNGYDAIQHIRQSADFTNDISAPETNIISDIENCKLPNVSYVTPPGLDSDHAGSLSSGGPGWVGSIYLAVAASCGYFDNTAIIVTWDDSGGWYDHVAPPVVNGVQWGFRVPLIFVSAYTPASKYAPLPYVDHTRRDFGSILKFIETNWNLGTLGADDATADNLSTMYDAARSPAQPIAAAKIRALISASRFNLQRATKDRTPPDNE